MPAKKTETQEEPVVLGSVFDTLNVINVNEHTEKKNGLTYLSWAWAWAEVKKAYPNSYFTIYERETEFGPVNYFTDGKTCWVKTGLTIEGLEHIEELPVMDFRNNSIPLERITSTDVNKAIQRSLTKAAARHGLGLYIYAGEDLPEEGGEPEVKPAPQKAKPTETKPVETKAEQPAVALPEVIKELDLKVQAMMKNFKTDEEKNALAARIKDKIGMVNYRNCKDAVKLSALLNELNAA